MPKKNAGDQRKINTKSAQKRIVLAMLAIKLQGKTSPGAISIRNQPGQQPGNAAGIVVILRKVRAEILFFAQDDRPVDQKKQHNQGEYDPETARGHCEAESNENGTEIERVACVGIWAGGGELG